MKNFGLLSDTGASKVASSPVENAKMASPTLTANMAKPEFSSG